MRRVLHPGTTILNARGQGAEEAVTTVTIAADPAHFWVIQHIHVHQDSEGETAFGVLELGAVIAIAFGGVTKWDLWIHPQHSVLAGSFEFEAGPWEFNLSPGLYTGTKNEAVVITCSEITIAGTGKTTIDVLYQ